MDIVGTTHMTETQKRAWLALLRETGLCANEAVDYTVLLWEEDQLVATGSRAGSIFKYFAVAPLFREEGLSAVVMTELRKEAFTQGIEHLFLYTRPENQQLFSDLCFSPVAKTPEVLLMENWHGGIRDFVASLPRPAPQGTVGAVVMRCDPFTRGHRYLLETAAGECDWLYVFVVSEEQGVFSAAERLEMVRRGTADLSRITVVPTGPYLVSKATFPSYFLRDASHRDAVHCRLDLEIFASWFAPALRITRRYVGTEPFSPVTAAYNRTMHAFLPDRGIEVREIPRKAVDDVPISAGAVRLLLETGQESQVRRLVTDSTWAYLQAHHLLESMEAGHGI